MEMPNENAGNEDKKQAMETLRHFLGVEAFRAAWAEGQALTWEQAIDAALGEGNLGEGSA